jgi:hypothetical protein
MFNCLKSGNIPLAKFRTFAISEHQARKYPYSAFVGSWSGSATARTTCHKLPFPGFDFCDFTHGSTALFDDSGVKHCECSIALNEWMVK